MIGSNISFPSATANGQLDIGNLIYGSGLTSVGSTISTGNIGVGTTSPSTKLQIDGSITPNIDNTYTTGNATYRWSAVYSANGTIQTSDQRLKTNITNLNYGLSDLLKLRPISFTWIAHPEQGTKLGFIAQEVQPIMPETVSVGDDTAHTLGLNYAEFIPTIIKAIQQLSQRVTNLASAVAGFTDSLTTKELTFTRATGDEIDVNKLCVNKSDGTPVCVTGDQLAAVLSVSGQISSKSGSSSSLSGSSGVSTTPNTPPVISIQGANPAIIQVGDTYADLGATVTGPQADLNLGIHLFLNRSPVDAIQLDTTTAATDTIDYVVSDGAGLTATSTRTVIIEAAQASSMVIDNASTSAATTSVQ